MRVTKVIKDYVAKEVTKRVEEKYANDKRAYSKQQEEREEFIKGCQNAMRDAFNKYVEEHFHEVSGFVKDVRAANFDPGGYYTSYHNAFVIKPAHDGNLVEAVHRKCYDEIKSTIEEIIVALELGGDREVLAKLLEEVGQV